MPVISEKKIGPLTVVLWRIDETVQEFGFYCTPDEMEYIKRFNTDTRKCEWLTWHSALRHILPDAQVEYNDAGAPVLKSGGYISVSHTKGFAAVALNRDSSCGIDIEHRNRNFTKAVRRISDQTEFDLITKSMLSVSDCEALLWCAKEALFKWAGETDIDFMKDVHVTEIKLDENIFQKTIPNEILSTTCSSQSIMPEFKVFNKGVLRGNVRGQETRMVYFFEENLCVVCCGL